MRRGIASPHEIAAALGISLDTVVSWRRREGLKIEAARIEHVRRLLHRKPRVVPVVTDPDAAPF